MRERRAFLMKVTFRNGGLFILLSLMVLVTTSSALAGEDGKIGWLGLSMQRLTSDLRETMDIQPGTGVLVKEVVEDSPAEKAGIQVGDVILKYDDKTVTSPRRLSKLVRKTAPGEKVKVEISRDGKAKTLTAEIGEREEIHTIKIKTGEGKGLTHLDPLCLEMIGLPHISCLTLGSDLWLGIQTVDLTDQLAKHFDIKEGRGVLVSQVLEDTPAEKVQLTAGDVIIKADGERIDDTSDLREAIAEHKEGQEMELVVLRKGKEKKLTVILEERPDQKEMKLCKKLQKIPQKLKRMKVLTPHGGMSGLDADTEKLLQDMDIDIEVEELLEDFDLEDLEERMEELEEELERIKEKLQMD
jgi:membrane-associated protease RseP (regulator of RpoE activity)